MKKSKPKLVTGFQIYFHCIDLDQIDHSNVLRGSFQKNGKFHLAYVITRMSGFFWAPDGTRKIQFLRFQTEFLHFRIKSLNFQIEFLQFFSIDFLGFCIKRFRFCVLFKECFLNLKLSPQVNEFSYGKGSMKIQPVVQANTWTNLKVSKTVFSVSSYILVYR